MINIININKNNDNIELKNLILLLYNQSIKYTSKHITTEESRKSFNKTAILINNIVLSTNINNEFFKKIKFNLDNLKREIKFKRTQSNNLLNIFHAKEKYDDIAFEIINDIIFKFKTRFITGYDGK